MEELKKETNITNVAMLKDVNSYISISIRKK